mmetsp:Transcript_20134/g.44944  ORF Transcript_20134/g.44944 Transcript_20134/m.44944 type:complete len:239 (-) Transcript_20134:671-1387(-)
MTDDPHILGAHLDRFDFKGKDGGVYVLLSTGRLSFAVRVEHVSFRTPFSKLTVRGSLMRHAYWTVKTDRGQLLAAHLDARHPAFNGSTAARKAFVDDVRFTFDGKALTVATSAWSAKAKVTRGGPHWGLLRLRVEVRALLRDAEFGAVAPHGLLGQTFDGDRRPLNGKRDRLETLDDGTPTHARKAPGGVVTTKADGEGAIEGTAEDYRINTPFATAFRFSRFGASAAPPRNISALRG